MKDQVDYKIVFDTNILRSFHEGGELGMFNLKALPIFLKEHTELRNVRLAVPEMVLREMAQQDLEDVERHVKQIEDASKALRGIGVRVSQNLHKLGYLRKIKATHKAAIKEHGIEVLPIPKLDQADIIERATTGKKPFASRGQKKECGDKGFKDAVIWQTLLQDAKINMGMNYIFCTKNVNDFPVEIMSPEIRMVNPKGTFRVFENILSIKEFLDSEFSLRLDLEKLHSEIEDEIERKVGSITVQLNRMQQLKTQLPFSVGNSGLAELYGKESSVDVFQPYSGFSLYKGRKGYDFLNLTIRDFNDSGTEGEYIIKADFFAAVALLDEKPSEYSEYSPNHFSFLPNEQDFVMFRINLLYKRQKKEVEVLGIDYPSR